MTAHAWAAMHDESNVRLCARCGASSVLVPSDYGPRYVVMGEPIATADPALEEATETCEEWYAHEVHRS